MGIFEKNYKEIARQTRLEVLKMIHAAQVSHVGSNFSCIDILTVLYENVDFKKDKLIVSKGWVAAAVYSLNVRHGLMPKEAITTYCDGKSPYIGLIEPLNCFGCEFAGGSMGMGLPFGVGAALAKKMKHENGTIYVLMSDGEMDCGTTWESALIASKYNLDNLVVIIDRNYFQAMGKTEEILPLDSPQALENKWWSFGWEWLTIDGHTHDWIKKTFIHDIPTLNAKSRGRPIVIFANTVKGFGVSFMLDNNMWHYLNVNNESYERAKAELGQ